MFDNNNDVLKYFIEDILNPKSKNIDHDKLEKFLLGFIDKMEHDNKPIDDDTKKIVGICLKLWNEKESWKEMYYKMYERYSKHLDEEISNYNKMLGR